MKSAKGGHRGNHASQPKARVQKMITLFSGEHRLYLHEEEGLLFAYEDPEGTIPYYDNPRGFKDVDEATYSLSPSDPRDGWWTSELQLSEMWTREFGSEEDAKLLNSWDHRQLLTLLSHPYPPGFDVAWERWYDEYSVQALLVHIPRDGRVRCQERFFGRIIGKKGVKIRELGEKHGIRIRLIPV